MSAAVIRGRSMTNEGRHVSEVLTPGAIDFLVQLHRQFEATRCSLLQIRVKRQQQLLTSTTVDVKNFVPETAATVRNSDWKIAPVPKDLLDRRVEITGPASSKKMVLNALSSGASCFMADLEDAMSPTWSNVIQAQINLMEVSQEPTMNNSIGKKRATLIVRPRGWHLQEAHFLVDGVPMSASLFDFGLHFFHNARSLLHNGTGPYFYLPKMESYLEARLWNDVFNFSQDHLGIARGTIKATVLIETILAAFQMDEILYELRDHSSGLNCGRWDYIFSFIKKFREVPTMVLSERALVTMQTPFMDSYVKLLIATCHRRGAHAMGGMAAFIPIKDDEVRNRAVLEKVRQDKLYEVQNGHDGTWVAHPGLIPVAKEVFDQHMKGPNQINFIPEAGKKISMEDLIRVNQSPRVSEAGVINNISAAVQYIEAWLSGVGAVAINNLMEDAATAEISRAQLWSWIRHKVKLDDGRVVTKHLVDHFIQSEMDKIRSHLREKWDNRQFHVAFQILRHLVFSDDFSDFLTLDAYHRILDATATAQESVICSSDANREQEAAEIRQWWSSPRFQHTKRPYSAEDVMRLRGSIKQDFASNKLARKLYWMLRHFQETKQTSLTFGCLDTVQVAQMAKYLTSVYVSGWQSSSTASTTNEPGPDFADYPYNTVPNKVDQLFKAQLFHDRKQRNDRASMTPEQLAKLGAPTDYLRPILADGDTGHGGLSATMKLLKEFVAAGAAGVHIEDQRAGAKKCGHMAGKVLVSTQEHIDRLCASRLQCDILGVETVLVARTDAEAANMIDSNVDPRDQPFIEGTTKKEIPALNEILRRTDSSKADSVSAEWQKAAGLCTYFEAVQESLLKKNQAAAVEWAQRAEYMSWADARVLAQQLGASDVFWCAEKPRTREGFYRFRPGVKTGISRAIAFAPYADVLWLETKKPDLKDAVEFAHAVKAAHPWAMLAYNLSPSFNWSAHGMSDSEIRDFVDRLAELGYVWQFITLAGFHADGLAIEVFAREFAQRKMLAYVELIQRPEGKEKVETLKHQQWSGAYLMDNQLVTATGGLASTVSMGAGVTENQFKSKM